MAKIQKRLPRGTPKKAVTARDLAKARKRLLKVTKQQVREAQTQRLLEELRADVVWLKDRLLGLEANRMRVESVIGAAALRGVLRETLVAKSRAAEPLDTFESTLQAIADRTALQAITDRTTKRRKRT